MAWGERGVTLIELLIAMVISALLVAAMYSFFMVQQRTYAVQDNVADMQQNARMSLITLVKNVRMAGYGVPNSCALVPVNSSTGPDGIFVSDHTVIQTLPDSDIFFAELNADVSSGATSITVTTTDIDGDGNDDFFATKALIISDGTNTEGMMISTNYATGNLTIPFASGYSLQHNYSAADTRVVPAILYNVQSNELRENNQPLALNVEDLQISYQDDGGQWYCHDAAHTSPPTSISSIRVVEVNVVARTNVQDAVVQDAAAQAQFNQPPLEDHTTTLNGPDGFRRRVLTTRAHVRNLGL
ncbi:MAG: PilW family protein [Deltaproteobacteria bacterium]|nr:PilW family protein [Deltaproteobacteria bacterium]